MSIEDVVVHGLPAGYEQGCRSAGGCANHGTELPVCRDAWTRFRSDFSYAKRVNRGLSPAEILAEERAEEEAARPVVVAAKRARVLQAERARAAGVERERAKAERAAAREQAKAERAAATDSERAERAASVKREKAGSAVADANEAVRAARAVLKEARAAVAAVQTTLQGAVRRQVAAEAALEVSLRARAETRAAVRESAKKVRVQREKPVRKLRAVKPHGTNAAYLRCRAAGAACWPCVEARREYYRDYVAKRKADGVPAEHHGTAYGYQLGCKDRGSCPASPSCADASLAEERRRRREAGVPAAVETVDAEPVREHVARLMHSGLPLLTIAERAEVSRSVLKNLLYGRSGARRGVRSVSVSVGNAEKILAVEPEVSNG